LAGCSFGGPVRVDRKAATYSFGEAGSRWARVQVGPEMAADHVFAAKGDGAILSIGSVCDRYLDSSLEDLAKDLTNPLREVEVGEQTRVPLDGREGLRTDAKGKLDGVPVELRTFVIRKDDCLFDFTITAKGALSNDDRRDFERVVSGFRYSGAAKP
jgi:hypothetical protein